MCQLPLRPRHQHYHVGHSSPAITQHDQYTQTSSVSAILQKQPAVARVKVSAKPFNLTRAGQWQPVTCNGCHVTHILLACDTLAACWAGSDVTFRHHSDTWACATLESCHYHRLDYNFPRRSLAGLGSSVCHTVWCVTTGVTVWMAVMKFSATFCPAYTTLISSVEINRFVVVLSCRM